MNKIVGIVGLPGSGKNYVCDLLANTDSTNVKVIDVDEITHKVLDQSVKEIRNNFGDAVFLDGKLDRKLLFEAFRNDPAKAGRHLAMVVPRIKKIVFQESQNAENADITYLNCPFLFEYVFDVYCYEIWLITASFETRLERVKRRGWDEAELKRRDAKFLPVEVLREKCDKIIVNEGTKEDIKTIIRRETCF